MGYIPKIGNGSDLTTEGHFSDVKISVFENVFQSESNVLGKEISLQKWIDNSVNPVPEWEKITGPIINKIRSSTNPDEVKELKKRLPAITPGAAIVSRSKQIPLSEKILSYSGYLQFDVDLHQNPHIQDAVALRDQIKNIVYVSFCQLSASARGVWGLIKISDPSKYKEHFEQLKRDFASLEIYLDPSKGGNPTDLRIYSYDPDSYINANARIYTRKFKVIQIKKNIQLDEKITGPLFTDILKQIETNKIDIAPDYDTYIRTCFAFAAQFGEEGRQLFHAVCQQSSKYDEDNANEKFDSCLKSAPPANEAISMGTFFYYCKQAGIKINYNSTYQGEKTRSTKIKNTENTVFPAKLHKVQSPFKSYLLENKKQQTDKQEIKNIVFKTSSDVFELSINDIRKMDGCTYTGRDFNYYILATFETKTGMYYTLLFDKDECIVTTKNSIIEAIESFYHKNFISGKIDGNACLISKEWSNHFTHGSN